MPFSAPISACEELEGSPARHVKRFQVIAPNSTAMSIDIATPPAGATRLPTVFATSAWRNCVVTTAPTRFKMAVKPTAKVGGNARVPIAVPTAFAVSWKPFVKSKRSATAMVRTRRRVCASGILDRDVLDHVRHVLATIERIFQEGVQILQLDNLQRIALALEELGDRVARGRVPDVLEAVDLDGVLAVLLAGSEFAYGLLQLLHRLCQEIGQLVRRPWYRRDPVQVHRVGYLLDVVEDVVEAGREGGDVLVVKGGDERLVEAAHDLVGDLVAPVLEVLDLPPTRRKV